MEIVCSDKYVPYLDKRAKLLEPIEFGSNVFQKNPVSLSKVYDNFAIVMKQAYESMNCS